MCFGVAVAVWTQMALQFLQTHSLSDNFLLLRETIPDPTRVEWTQATFGF